MKNIEMYKDINKALKAWSMARCIHPFSVWLQEDYVDQESPTLLEVASKFVNCVEMPCNPQEQKHWDELCAAVKREKAKPVRNCDRFATAGGGGEGVRVFQNDVRQCLVQRMPLFPSRNPMCACMAL